MKYPLELLDADRKAPVTIDVTVIPVYTQHYLDRARFVAVCHGATLTFLFAAAMPADSWQPLAFLGAAAASALAAYRFNYPLVRSSVEVIR